MVNFLLLTTMYRHVGPNISFASKILDKLGLIAAKSIILRPWKNNSKLLHCRMDVIFNYGITIRQFYKLQGAMGYFDEIMGSLYCLLRQG